MIGILSQRDLNIAGENEGLSKAQKKANIPFVTIFGQCFLILLFRIFKYRIPFTYN